MSEQNQKSKDLKVRVFQFSLSIINILKTIPHTSEYWSIKDQLLRSATSIGANILEAQGSSSQKEFTRCYEMGLKSCYETIYWLSILRDGYNIKVDGELDEIKEIMKMLKSSILTLKSKRKK